MNRNNRIEVRNFLNCCSEEEFNNNLKNCCSWILEEFSKSDFFYSLNQRTVKELKEIIDSYYQGSKE